MVRCSVFSFELLVVSYPTWSCCYSTSEDETQLLRAEYPNCTTGTIRYIGDGYCDYDLNVPECGFDGGDCCICTCVPLSYSCDVAFFNCSDPDAAAAEFYYCEEPPPPVLPCSAENEREWVVKTAAQARTLAEAVNCSGGAFEVEWMGHVVVDKTIYVVDGTVLNVTGVGTIAGMDGNGSTRLFTVVNASLHVRGVNISYGAGVLGGGIAAAGSSMTLNRTGFIGNSADLSGGGLFVSDGSNVTCVGKTFFFNNTANTSGGGALVLDGGSNISWSGELVFSGNIANFSYGGALVLYGGSSVSWSGETVFSGNTGYYRGGALAVYEGSSVSWSGETLFSGNAAIFGGALDVVGSIVSWSGETVFSGNADGALIVVGSNVSWSGETIFSGNTAVSGGALAMMDGSSVSWSGKTRFSGNTAYIAGGALEVDGSNVSWSERTIFSGNRAENGSGGAVSIEFGSRVEWTGQTEFVSNFAVSNGGAVVCQVLDADFTIASVLIINGTTNFVSNTCEGNGGGLALLGALSVTFGTTDITFDANSAEVAGGAVFLSGAGIGPVFKNTPFISNSAQVGGAVYATGSGTTITKDEGGEDVEHRTTFIRCSFTSNEATTTGGAVESAAGRDSVVDTLFVGNRAGVGGALRLAGIASVRNCAFEDNASAEGAGPAISNIGVISKMLGCSFQGNLLSCVPGTFLDYYNEPARLYEAVCSGCPSPCVGCTFEDRPWIPTCTPKLEHSTSPGGTVTLAELPIDSGYWRATTTSRDVLACYNADACLGGVTGASGYCDEGYGGPYCSVCADGYTASLGFVCTKCSDSAGAIILVVLAVIALVVAVTVVSYMVSGELEGAGRGIVDRLTRYVPLQSLKIIIVAWQILTQFAAVANVTYPDVYQRFLDGVDVLNFDLRWIFSAGCVFDVDFHDRLFISTIGPIIAMAFLGATYAVAVRRNRGSENVLRNIRHKHVSMVLLVTFLVYSSVSSILFQMFACEKLDDGKNYLRADYRIECDSSRHEALQIYAGFMIVLYTVGIPAFYAGLLFKNRDMLKDRAGREESLGVTSTSDLWKPYKPGRYYYEVIECGRRILLAGVVVFIYPNTAAQIAVTLMIAMFFVFVSEGLAPYSSRWDSWISRMGHAIVLTSMYVALLLKVDVSDERASSQRVFEAILVGPTRA